MADDLPLLDIRNLSISFESEGQTTPALKGISFELRKGETVAIVGESGSGKSVTSLSVLGLLPSPPAKVNNGEIVFSPDGTESEDILLLQEEQLRKLRGNRISMIFQEPMTSLNPVYSCGDQVREAILLHQDISREEAHQKTLDLFEKVRLPNPALIFKRYPHELSGGQKQRVMIAMAVSCNPSLLIADEPTTALDVTVQKTILELLKDLQQQYEMGLIFISHDLAIVAELADRIIVMYKGDVVEQGLTEQVLHHPQHPYTKSLLACRPQLHGKGERLPVVTDFMRIGEKGEILEVSTPAVVLKNSPDHVVHGQQNAIVSVKDLEVKFPLRKNLFGKTLEYLNAVDRVSFDVFEGETLGLVGESGCGKSTLGRAMLRLIEPSSGSVFFRNENMATLSKERLRDLRREMQIIFQDPYSSLNPRIPVGRAILEPLEVHGILQNGKQRLERVYEMLAKVDLKPAHFNRYPHQFSGGQRQRVVIARALALNPSFVICDESVSSLDVSVQAQVLNLLNDLKRELNFTVVFISHDLSVVRYLSDRIMVMQKGKIVESGNAEEIYQSPQSAYTQKLIGAIPGLL